MKLHPKSAKIALVVVALDLVVLIKILGFPAPKVQKFKDYCTPYNEKYSLKPAQPTKFKKQSHHYFTMYESRAYRLQMHYFFS
jgi:hypothetical protein